MPTLDGDSLDVICLHGVVLLDVAEQVSIDNEMFVSLGAGHSEEQRSCNEHQ